ncbi:MAG: hypothetical protein A2566_02060 [Candidatus Zambryskibacteria bacterium RIFOXYD1_FULL_40_13]|nr:MAG: Second mannosyl transferase [Parcubacteria group bacterium GW2011_GWC1_39_12]KKR18960.1 MAG: Second mannosyl transferase [Parcubacteria group bacterium GW2011_GWF1_39_37]KKR35485.1 MAG: Second mannosyl transferase [Parcubacteria group bacterium GW2011_GWC2_40_10]KKR51975.1 MAG: Second mannosyl transferase [Parcubacteria group bacterium GW2011_GWE1_40_20]KKR68476.1 MAG: Second mannosyl transferase [Parcubacteria group bacterium GW2011_GWF2_40_69]KKR81706.1 MAG: Second mannosyl transfera
MQDLRDIKPKKKVCFFVTKGVWGGAQKYVYSLATSLPKNSYDVFVVVGEGKILKDRLEEKNIRTYEIAGLRRDISVLSEIRSFLFLLKILRKESPDVLHLNSPKAGGLGTVVGRLLGIKKIIFTVHGWTFNETRSKLGKMFILLLSWLTVLLSHKTIVIAEKERKQALRMPFSKNKVTLIKNGVDKISFVEKEIARKELLLRCGYEMSAESVLWLGTISELHKNKGLEYTISALSKIDTPFICFIIGEGEERQNLEKLLKANNMENKVFLVGFLSEANQYLKAFDIFTLTSVKEGLPYTILEAGLAGLPVIASSVGGIPDIITSDTNGILVEKTNVEQITKAIQYMIDYPSERKMFGLKLQERMEKEFSLKQMLEKTINLYNQ